MPRLAKNTVLFIEDDDLAGEYTLQEFERNLVSLMHQDGFDNVAGIIIGRFQPTSKVDMQKLKTVLVKNLKLGHLPIIANVDFGHTCPISTIPLGGRVQVEANTNKPMIKITNHL